MAKRTLQEQRSHLCRAANILRQGFLQDDRIEAVIGLAPNLFYGTGIPACVLILSNKKPASTKGKVLIVNGADEMVPEKKP